ncbi:MAG: glycosyltransferase [Bacteriovoracaceae bacterium]|nr:glycosyltransferase [Bacteriovoracaceae bacterium]
MTSEPCVGIVIPCFNEAQRLAGDAFVTFAQQHPSWHLVFVDDGSTDATKIYLQNLIAPHTLNNVHLLTITHQGKAAAVRAGMYYLQQLNISWEVCGFYDADQSAPLAELARLVANFHEQKNSSPPSSDALFASRIQYLGTHIQRRWWRHYLGRIFATVISLMVDLSIYDSQCGLKLFRAKQASEIFAEEFISPWFFDVELIFRLKKLGATITECPLQAWQDKGHSKLKWQDFVLTPWYLAKIYIHYCWGAQRKNRSPRI